MDIHDRTGSTLVVYTAIFGRKDRLREPEVFPKVDYVCFTDDPSLRSKVWRIICVKGKGNPRRLAKIYKILPHRFFPEYEWSLWVDGTHLPAENPQKLAYRFLKDKPMALFVHPERNCIYDEAKECLRRKLDQPRLIQSQIKKYKEIGYPARKGLAACTIIFRRHQEDLVKKAMEEWWKEIEEFSSRDQLSFNFVMWKHALRYTVIPWNIYINKYFTYKPHLDYIPSKKRQPDRGFFLNMNYWIGRIGYTIRAKSPFSYYVLKRFVAPLWEVPFRKIQSLFFDSKTTSE